MLSGVINGSVACTPQTPNEKMIYKRRKMSSTQRCQLNLRLSSKKVSGKHQSTQLMVTSLFRNNICEINDAETYTFMYKVYFI